MEEVVAGLDVGGTVMKGGLVDAYGQLVWEERWPTGRERGPEAVVEGILDAAERLVLAADGRLRAVGLAVPGIVDSTRGVAVHATNLAWHDVVLVERVTERTGLPAFLGHDVRCGGYAEARAGAAGSAASSLFVAVGTGIGGAFTMDGRTLEGATSRAAELGHLVVRSGGPACGCGGLGCLEAIASASAITREYAAAAGAPELPAVEIGRRAARGDEAARAVWDDAVDALGQGLAGAVTLFDPELVVVGGGLSQAGDLLLAPLTVAVTRWLPLRPPPPLRTARFGDRAGCVGAGLQAWDRLRPCAGIPERVTGTRPAPSP